MTELEKQSDLSERYDRITTCNRERGMLTSSLFFPLKEKSAVTNFGTSDFDMILVLNRP